jgi:arylsulfatase
MEMNTVSRVWRKWMGAALALAGCAQYGMAQDRPNIVVIMADDMGYSDLGCCGSEIQTPNLDALAEEGILFTEFYNAARCCPSRASILTGLYPHQAGIGAMAGDPLALNKQLPAYQGYLGKDCVTLGEALQLTGYYTIFSGKWHVGDERPEMMPFSRGFERTFFTPGGAASYFTLGWAGSAPRPYTLDGQDHLPGPGFYDTDAVFDFTLKFIADCPADRPFFAYVTPKAPHWPLHAKPEDIAKYKGAYDCGWDEIRSRRHEKQVELGLVSKRWEPAVRGDGEDGVPEWSSLSPEQQKETASRMEVYAAQVDCLDQNVGKLVKYLKEQGRFDNTLILFLSDNGACAELQTEPLGSDWLNGKGGPIGTADSFASYGRVWAEVSNTPFRLWKQKIHEGGISTPLIAAWPNGIRPKGTISRQPGHIVDVMATCLDLCGGTYPDTYKGQSIQPLEGISFAPVFQGLERVEHDEIAWEHFANRGIRQGKWKLVSQTQDLWTHASPGPWELYDLRKDRTEMTDLAEKYPEKVKELSEKYSQWAQRNGIVDKTADWRQKK